jgi:hypothetical protein
VRSSSGNRRSNEGAPILRKPLTEADYDSLSKSWIDRFTADRAQLARLDHAEGKALVGGHGSGNYSGVEFPYCWPGELHVRGVRLRRDEPDMELEYSAGGLTRIKQAGKYLAGPRSGNLLYLFPETPPELLNDTSVPAVLTEGEKKVLSLWRLANHNCVRPRFLPVGLSGVWNWRGKVGISETASGKRRAVKGPIPDLSRINWAGRTVYIAFDSDAVKEQVAAARAALAQELRRRGAKVFYVIIPPADVPVNRSGQ